MAVHTDTWHALGEFVTTKMQEIGVPGVAVGMWHHGEVTAQGFGVTNVDHPLPVTATTLFQIGSITKTFTGTLVMRLVEEGKLDLDTPVQHYVPEFRVVDEAASTQATLRHLLTHTGGWEGDLFLDTGPADDALAKYVAAMAAQTQLAPIGSHFSYNNAGFALAGLVIERVTGQRFEAALQRYVLDPLGMEQTFLEPGDAMTHRFVVGHGGSRTTPEVLRPWSLSRATRPMGGLVTHVHDLLRYARFHMSEQSIAAQPVIRPESIAQMAAPQVTVWGAEARGLAWSLNKVGGVQTVSHGGGTHGQITLLTLAPERDFAATVFTNAQRGGELTRTVTEWMLRAFLGLESPSSRPLASTPEELAAFTGLYGNMMSQVELGVLNGRLIGQTTYLKGFPTNDSPLPPAPPPIWLERVEPDRLMIMEGDMKETKIDVVRTAQGEIGWLRGTGRLYRKVR
jgi:CubicO group peptidase (beta-lactamase class C family)